MTAVPVLANPVPADEVSLFSGAELFTNHCTQCHGWDPTRQGSSLYEAEQTNNRQIDMAELIAIAQGGTQDTELPEDATSSWVELVDPGADREEEAYSAREREALLAELTGAIDTAYGIGGESLEQVFEDAGQEVAATGAAPEYMNDAYPGATDLTQPQSYYYGLSEFDLFEIIAGGTENGMPAFRDELGNEEAIWDLVNYIRSLWGGEWLD